MDENFEKMMATMQRNIDLQMRQLTEAINNRNQGELPSQHEINPQKQVKEWYSI